VLNDINKAQTLLEINKMLTKSLKINQILKDVVHAATKIIGVSGVFIIYLYNKETNRLYFVEGKGVNEQHFNKIAFTPGESIAGKIFLEQKSKLFISESEIDQYMENMTPINYEHYYQGVSGKKIKNAFVVPIVSKKTCHGVIVADSFFKNDKFTEEDLRVIEIVAGQSAIAIDNALLYQDLERKNKLLTQSTSIHTQFYQLILEGKGAKSIIFALENILGKDVYFDYFKYSKEPYFSFPIKRGEETLGYLKFDCRFETFSHMEQIAIEQASLTIVLELIKNNALFEKEIHFREEVFNQIINNVSDRDFYHALQYLEWEKNWEVQCLIFEKKGQPFWQQEFIMGKERCIQNVEKLANSLGLKHLIFTKTSQLIIIIPKLSNKSKDILIRNIIQYQTKSTIFCGIGRKTTMENLSLSYQEATRSLSYAITNNTQIIEYEELGVERLLYEVDKEVLNMFIHDILKNIHLLNNQVIHTLATFINHNRSHKLTAASLYIHPNTLYYRLKKIEETLDLRLDEDKDWINLVIAFRLYVETDNDIY